MNAGSNSALFLSYATAIATFSAAAVALGLFYCVTRIQRAVAILVLLFAMLGIASSLIALAKQHSMQGLNVLIATGFAATGGYVLYAALSVIFTDPRAHDEDQHGYWLWLHKRGGVAYGPVLRSFSLCVAILLGLFVAATPSLLDNLTEPQPAESFTEGGPPHTYTDLCDDGSPLGWPAPDPQRSALNDLWLGPEGAGAIQAGCPEEARHADARPDLWFALGICAGRLSSIGLANGDGNSALLLGQAADFIYPRVLEGSLLGVPDRLPVGSGEVYLVNTEQGTTALVGGQASRRPASGLDLRDCVGGDPPRYAAVPPPLVDLWIQMMNSIGTWTWPFQELDRGGRSSRFLFTEEGDATNVLATAMCNPDGCTLSWGGRVLSSTADMWVAPDQLLEMAPAAR